LGELVVNYKDLERRLKRQLSETVASNDSVIELPPPADYKAWQARWRKHIRCMIWWDELKEPKPKLSRFYYTPFGDIHWPLYYPWTEGKGEWRRKKPNPPTRVPVERFDGHRVIQAPGLSFLPKGVMLLDGAHRIQDLEPMIIIVDAIEVKREQLTSIADTIGSWWHE
jgi:hypothetical protein